MRLLVTRPEPDAAATAVRLTALGHQPLVQPLLKVSFNDPPQALERPAAILITSQNAVRAIGRWPQSSTWHDVPVFVAGAATGRATAALGFSDIRTGARDSSSLADVVINSMMRGSGPILYPAARDRAGALAGGLTARGYDVRTVEAYRADAVEQLRPMVREAVAAGAIDGILLYSGRTAKALLSVGAAEGLSAALAWPEYFVISAHVADIVRGLGVRVHVARRPDEDSLMALIPAAE
jgi:uroporphyrinogen-III synthase